MWAVLGSGWWWSQGSRGCGRGVSCPGPGYLRAPSTSVSSEPSQPKSVCLMATAWSEMHVFREVQRGLWPTWSKPLISTEEELIPLNSLVTGRACPSPSPSQAPSLSHSAACSKICLCLLFPLGPVHLHHRRCTRPYNQRDQPRLWVLGSSISIPRR